MKTENTEKINVTTEIMNDVMDRLWAQMVENLEADNELSERIMQHLEESCGLKRIGDK